MKKIIITDYIQDPDIERAIFGEGYQIVCLNQIDESLFPADIDDCAAMLVWHAKISESTVGRLRNCRAIIRYGVGYDNIDYACLQRNGILFCNTPDYGVHEVADTACAMMLALARNIYAYNERARKGGDAWEQNTLPDLHRLNQHKLGIIGAGRIGSAVALRMKAFGVSVAFFDPFVACGYEKTLGAERFDSIEELLAFSTILSIHAPLTEATRGLVDKNFIDGMNDGTVFVNTARGGIVNDLDHLVYGLESGKISGLGLDVLPHEPPEGSERLLGLWRDTSSPFYQHIIINPHTAYFSHESWIEMRQKTAENAKRILEGKQPRSLIS